MSEEEIKEYINRKDELLLKLSGKDKDTLEWILFGYNECARLLYEKEQENQKLKNQQKEFIEWLEYQVKLQEELKDMVLATGFEEVLEKYKEIIGVDK